MNSILTGITATFLIILLSFPLLYNSWEFSGLVETEKNKTGSLKNKNRNIMRGTPMVLGKNLKSSVDFATDIKNWGKIKNNGFNTIRVCWVDPWYKDHDSGLSHVQFNFKRCCKKANAKTQGNLHRMVLPFY